MAARDPGLTTHVLDTARGRPAGGMAVELVRDGAVVASLALNEDGRTDRPLLTAETFRPGAWELRFHVGAYFRALGLGDDPPFHDVVTVRVTLQAGRGHYHVPLLVSPFGYTTYRGS
ncbi:MAG: hydroxyisourate hydrolase [Acetobacteraceae bacterium]